MKARFQLIVNESSGDILHLGSTNSEDEDNLQDTLSKHGKVYSCDLYGTPDYKIDLNDIKWNIDKKFDTIVAGEIIEHVRDPINFLKNCYDLLKDGGKIIVTTPNATSLSYLSNPNWCVSFDNVLCHIHCFTSGMLEALIKDAGFKNIQLKYLNSYSKNPITIIVGGLIPRVRGGLIAVATK
jgi:SAM-dependent methyltransferase